MGKSAITGVATKKDDTSNKMFVGTMIGMSWQMAVAVLVPTVLGYKLDAHFKTDPLLTLVGLAMAVIASVLIIRNALKNLNVYMMNESAETKEIQSK